MRHTFRRSTREHIYGQVRGRWDERCLFCGLWIVKVHHAAIGKAPTAWFESTQVYTPVIQPESNHLFAQRRALPSAAALARCRPVVARRAAVALPVAAFRSTHRASYTTTASRNQDVF